MSHHMLILICALLIPPLIGCTPPQSPAVSNGTVLKILGDPSLQTSIEYVGLDDRIALIIWTDVVGSSNSSSTDSPGGISLRGELNSNDGRKLAWKCDASTDGTGTLTLSDTQYDLAEGFVFLVSTRDGLPKVQQVKRGTIAASTIDQKIRELAKEKEVTAFFSKQSTPEDRPNLNPEG
jgi:hypothetical protein